MDRPFRITRWAALALLGAGMASAQEAGLSAAFKLRYGHQLNQPAEDSLDRRLMGFGVSLDYTRPVGTFSLEVGFQYKSGSDYAFDFSKMQVDSGAPPVDPGSSVDNRKDSLQGITARLAFERPVRDTDFCWRVGFQVGGARFKQTYIADVADANWTTYEDTYNGQAARGTMAFSPLVGVGYRLSATNALELNLVNLAWKAVAYNHVAGTDLSGSTWGGHTSKDSVIERTRHGLHLEIGYVYRF